MGIRLRRRVYRSGALCLITGSSCSGVLASWLLAEAVGGDHSRSGKILLVEFGLLLLLNSMLVYIFGVVYLKSSKLRLKNITH